MLVAIALLARGAWNQRAKLLFNVFKCIGTEEMGHEDIILAAQVRKPTSIAEKRIINPPKHRIIDVQKYEKQATKYNWKKIYKK